MCTILMFRGVSLYSVPLYVLQAHTGNECAYQPQHCSINGCTAELPKLHLLQHMENECPFRSVCCEYCRQKVVFKCLEVSG